MWCSAAVQSPGWELLQHATLAYRASQLGQHVRAHKPTGALPAISVWQAHKIHPLFGVWRQIWWNHLHPHPHPQPYPLLKLGLQGRSPLTLTFSEVRSQSQRDADLASFPQTFIHNSDVAPIRGKTSVKGEALMKAWGLVVTCSRHRNFPEVLAANSVCWPKRSFCSHLRMRVKHHTGVKGIHILYLSKSTNTYVKTNWSKSNWFNFFT